MTIKKSMILMCAVLVACVGCKGSDGRAEQATFSGNGGAEQTASPPVTPNPWTNLGTRQLESKANVVQGGKIETEWGSYQPEAIYPATYMQDNVPIHMADGVVLSASILRPTDQQGNLAGALPTIVTFTPYNKNFGDSVPLGGGFMPYFVQRGYNHILIDVRGTGRSGGSWDPFSAREQADYPQVIEWILNQPWSNGELGMWGISATATASYLAALQGHPAIKAVFANVAHADIYRDVVSVGGQASAGFLPVWMSVVTGLGILNPTFYDQPEQQFTAVFEHAVGSGEFTLPKLVEVLTAQDPSFDSAYWGEKAPLEKAAGLAAPTFLVGGLFDIFQRGEPLNYEAIKNRVNAKLLLGPWHHLQAAGGEGLPLENVPDLDHIAIQWFDHYLRDVDNGAEDLPRVTQWVWGYDHFDYPGDWPHPQAEAERFYLQPGNALALEQPEAAEASSQILQHTADGVCSQSALQISIGLFGYLPLPCWYENNLVETLEVTFDTAKLAEDMYINGPMQADLWISTTALDAGVVVRVSDVHPDGTSVALTSGLQTASLRKVDPAKSRYLNGEMIQPWHPLTVDSQQELGLGEIVKVPVEIFPTSALIKAGHRLRISVGPSNAPFAVMPVPTLIESLAGILSIHHDRHYPSSLVVPLVPASALNSPFASVAP